MAGQPPIEKELVLAEREKDRRETIVIGPVAAPSVTPPPVEPVPASPPPSSSSTLKTAGYIVGGAGIVGVGVGAILGILAIGDKSTANCTTSGSSTTCANPSAETSAIGIANGSTAAIVAGGVLLAGGVVMVVVGRKSSGSSTTGGLEIGPMVGSGNGGMWLRGSF
jgi:hypothetical protein